MKACQTTFVQEITQTKSDGTVLHLTYSLTSRESEFPHHLLYGICVRKQEYGQSQPEEARTPPISYSEHFVRRLLQQVITHGVTPMCLLEVIDELLSAFEEQLLSPVLVRL